MQCVALARGLPAVAHARCAPRAARQRSTFRRGVLVVKAHDEDEAVLPIWSGRFAEVDPEKVHHNAPKLGGKTIAEELTLMHDDYVKAEHDTDEDMHKHLYSKNWQGDVYTGSNWNILTLLMGLIIATPLAGLVFAWASYGTLWTGHYYGI